MFLSYFLSPCHLIVICIHSRRCKDPYTTLIGDQTYWSKNIQMSNVKITIGCYSESQPIDYLAFSNLPPLPHFASQVLLL